MNTRASLLVSVLLLPVCVFAADATSVPASAPATQPGGDLVLIRFGNEGRITQADFEARARGELPVRYPAVAAIMTREKLYALYAQDHPDLVPADRVEAEIKRNMQRARVTSRAELEALLKKRGMSYDNMREGMLSRLAEGALTNRGSERAAVEAERRKEFTSDPDAFNGTTVSARHILITSAPYDPPAIREAKRARVIEMRKAILAGTSKWENEVAQSDARDKFSNGDLGYFTRHLRVTEPLAAAAFALKPGEMSDPVESDLGFHLIWVVDRKQGGRSFEDDNTQRELKLWMEQAPTWAAMAEARKRHPVIGERAPVRTQVLIENEPKPESRPE